MAKKKTKTKSEKSEKPSSSKASSKDSWKKYALGGAAVIVVIIFLVLAANKPAEKVVVPTSSESCGNGVCERIEYASGSCPSDCPVQVAEPVVPVPEPPKPVDSCGDGICSDAEKFVCDADCEVENLDAQPVCSGVGTKYEGWYQNGKILFYAFCGGCTAECKNRGTVSEGWFNSCDGKQIKRMCG